MATLNAWDRLACRRIVQRSYLRVRVAAAVLGFAVGTGLFLALHRVVAG
jgi:hypothetical protein